MNETRRPGKSGSGKSLTATTLGLIVVTVLSLAFAGYSLAGQHSTTVTQQQLLTNTQTFYNTQTSTSLATITNVETTTRTVGSNVYQYNNFEYCGYYGCYYNSPPAYTLNPPCQPMGNNTYQCSGWLYQDAEGCIDLIIPVTDRFGYQVYEYYALHNLPSSYPPILSWVTVTGLAYRGNSMGPNGAGCPTNNYIIVTSITQ